MRFASLRTDSATDASVRRRKRLAASLAVGLVFVCAGSSLTASQDDSNVAKPAPAESSATAPPLSLELPTSTPGQVEFEEAVELRMNAKSLEDLNEVVKLSESAIKSGLSPLNDKSAKLFLASAYKQRVEQSMQSLMKSPRNRAAVSKMLGEYLSDLTRSIDLDPELVDSYLLKVAILRDRQEFDEALKVIDKAIEVQEPQLESKSKSLEFRDRLAKLYVARSTLREDTNLQIEDVEKAAMVNPTDTAIVKQLLATLESQQALDGSDNTDRMIQVIDKALEYTTDSLELQLTKIGLLIRSDKKDDALAFTSKLIDQSIDDESKSTLLRQRALIHQLKGDSEATKADLNQSISLAKDSVASILLRARLSADVKNYDEARKDVDAILELDESNLDALLLRGDLAAATEDYDTAINDYRQVLARIPNGNPVREGILLKLSLVFWQSNKHSQAIRNLDQVLRSNPANWQALRLKGEICLSQGEHADAIEAYKAALSILPEEESDDLKASVMNNLSWVLSTTPEDELRNGKLALELGLKACELTEFKQAHILSTLAAAYAEVGDFDKAVEFSEKAVETGKKNDSEQVEQLEEELKSFRDKKPWREKQEVSEAKKPIIPAPVGPEI